MGAWLTNLHEAYTEIILTLSCEIKLLLKIK